jgi:peptide/nickel transport system substrate-binding protein
MAPTRVRQAGSRSRSWRRVVLPVAGVAALALVAAGCSSTTSSGTTPVKGGTAVMAEPPSQTPDYIFPFMDPAVSTNQNLFDFTYLMYRPLYWFGQGSQPVVNPSLSLASLPVFTGRNVTITLKPYMWSNGSPVTAADVAFWINMMRAVPQDWFGSVPGGFPTNISDVRVVSATKLTMTMNKPFSPTWFLYNNLSQITPMPAAWDRTASGPSSCATTVSDCTAVYSYLAGQAKDLSSYATSPIWSIVDGPWRLSAFNADGHVTFVPNKSYSGPVKPKLAEFQEVPFTTDAAEYNVLRASAAGGQKIDFGYLPDQDAPPVPAGKTVGANPLGGYTLAPIYPWGIDYYAMNFNSTNGDHAAIFKQLYFRQVMAHIMNQQAIIKGPLRGYARPTVGPVANVPPTSFLSAKGRQGEPYAYSVSAAKALLVAHGWKVTPNGVSTCVKPGSASDECGAGVTKGSGLSFNFVYESGLGWVTSEMDQLQSSGSEVGIKLNLEPKPFADVLSVAGGNCVVVKSPCNWDLANWGFGWSFSPDYLPTGDELFACGAVANSGGYCDKTNDSLIDKTLYSSNLQYMYQWQDYLSPQMPVQYQPLAAFTLTEIANNLKGALPQSPTLSINPEDWYFVK